LALLDVKTESFDVKGKPPSIADTVNPDLPHNTMRSMAAKDPYSAMLVGAVTLDTKGGL
jgi:hypothetical protein